MATQQVNRIYLWFIQKIRCAFFKILKDSQHNWHIKIQWKLLLKYLKIKITKRVCVCVQNSNRISNSERNLALWNHNLPAPRGRHLPHLVLFTHHHLAGECQGTAKGVIILNTQAITFRNTSYIYNQTNPKSPIKIKVLSALNLLSPALLKFQSNTHTHTPKMEAHLNSKVSLQGVERTPQTTSQKSQPKALLGQWLGRQAFSIQKEITASKKPT